MPDTILGAQKPQPSLYLNSEDLNQLGIGEVQVGQRLTITAEYTVEMVMQTQGDGRQATLRMIEGKSSTQKAEGVGDAAGLLFPSDDD